MRCKHCRRTREQHFNGDPASRYALPPGECFDFDPDWESLALEIAEWHTNDRDECGVKATELYDYLTRKGVKSDG